MKRGTHRYSPVKPPAPLSPPSAPQRYGSSVIIYGISDDTVELGRSLIAGGTHNIIYAGSKPAPTCEAAINAAGALVRSDISALNTDRSFSEVSEVTKALRSLRFTFRIRTRI